MTVGRGARRAVLLAVSGCLGGLVACRPKGSDDAGAVADSTAVADSVAPDSLASRTDSITARRDSAFPPKFLIDSAGKVTPVPKSKKP